MKKNNLLLIIYKNKILLTTRDFPFDDGVWSFVGEEVLHANSQNGKTTDDVATSLSITSESTGLIGIENGISMKFAHLTDKNVNSIERINGERLEFYSQGELSKLTLSESSLKAYTLFGKKIADLLAS